MARLLLISAALMLTGCAAPESFTAGQQVAPPYGWVDFCRRHPTDLDCK